MYTIITKWTPNSNTARYLSFRAVEYIMATGNMENDLPWDWTGSKEGFYDKMEPRRRNSGSN